MSSDTMLTQRWENYVTKQTNQEANSNLRLIRGRQDSNYRKRRREQEIKRIQKVVNAHDFDRSLNPSVRRKTRHLLKILKVNRQLSK